MSLKYVHLVFIIMASLLLAGFSIWCLMKGAMTGFLVGGIVGVVMTMALIIYGVLYWKKINQIIT